MAASSYDEALVERVARALVATRLEAIVVGGVAAALHGAPVTTLDVDLLVTAEVGQRQGSDVHVKVSSVSPTGARA